MLELHEARHEGAAGKAVGPVQPPDPGAQHVPQELEPLAVHALLHVHAEEGHELLAGRRGEAEALRHVRGVRPVQALPDLHARRGSPVQVVVQLRGEVVVHEEQVAHLLGVGLPVQAREVSCSQLSLAALAQEWPEHSCRQRRIDWGNPVANTGLPGPHQARTRPARWRGICNGACVFFFTHFEDFSAVSQTVRICKFSGERQRNTRPANLKKLTV